MRSLRGVYTAPFFLFLVLYLSACASSSISGYRQHVLVTSDVPGVAVYDRGRYVGTTPGFMRIRRRHHPEIEFRRGDKTLKTVRLTTKYRWYDSFWGNALFVTLAPVGWGIDWATGTAWEIQDPQLLNTSVPTTGARLAVAPPEIADRDLADALGPQIEKELRQEKRFLVRPYEETLPQFDYFDTSSTLPEDKGERNALLGNLQSHAVFLSRATETDSGIKVEGDIRNVFSGESMGQRQFTLPAQDAGAPLRERIPRYFHILPNTAFVNFTGYRASLNIDNLEYSGKAVSDGSTLEDVTRIVSAIGLSRLQRPRRNAISRWTFDFVPTVNFSTKRFRFEFFSPPQDQEFDRIYVSGGYGIEVGYMWKYGFPYLDVIPTVSWMQLTYDVGRAEKVIADWDSGFVLEAGYQYFFSDHFVGRFFTRTLQENTSLWKRAVSDVFGRDVKVEAASSVVSGLAIGYYFPSGTKRRR